MDRNLASILALAGTAAISVTLAAMGPGDTYADDSAAGQKVSTCGPGSSERLPKTLLAEGTDGSLLPA